MTSFRWIGEKTLILDKEVSYYIHLSEMIGIQNTTVYIYTWTLRNYLAYTILYYHMFVLGHSMSNQPILPYDLILDLSDFDDFFSGNLPSNTSLNFKFFGLLVFEFQGFKNQKNDCF